jgi:hypothetical protein
MAACSKTQPGANQGLDEATACVTAPNGRSGTAATGRTNPRMWIFTMIAPKEVPRVLSGTSIPMSALSGFGHHVALKRLIWQNLAGTSLSKFFRLSVQRHSPSWLVAASKGLLEHGCSKERTRGGGILDFSIRMATRFFCIRLFQPDAFTVKARHIRFSRRYPLDS